MPGPFFVLVFGFLLSGSGVASIPPEICNDVVARDVELAEQRLEKPAERERFFFRRRSPDGVSPLPVEKYVQALEHMDRMPQYSTPAGQLQPSRAEARRRGVKSVGAAALGTWTWLGPGNVGGRTRALLIHPTNESVMYAAGVSGGIWRSVNAGDSWVPLADLMANIAVCSLAMDPFNPNVIYAGTGEGYLGTPAARGAGIFKTVDGGESWTRLSATSTPDFHYVNKIVISPLAGNRVYAATHTGIFRSTDAGTTWTKVFSSAAHGGLMDLIVRTDQPTDVMLASDGQNQAAIYRNPDAGGSGAWTRVHTEPNMGRTSLAIAPSHQNTIYAMAVNTETNGLLAVLRSTDGGASWTHTLRSENPGFTDLLVRQGWYNNVIAVDPLEPNRVWAGGVSLWKSDDGAVTWERVGVPHVDHHVIAFHPRFNGTSNQRMYLGNDGGLWRSDDARAAAVNVTWTSLNNGYGVTQFYHGLPYPGGRTYIGGTQDNGTVRGTDGGGQNAWTQVHGGDGGPVAIDPADTNVLYIAVTSERYKTTDGGKTWVLATKGITDWITFQSPFVMDPSNARILWTGNSTPWRSTDGAVTWVQAGAPIDIGVSAIAVAPTDSNYVLYGVPGGIARSHTALSDDSSAIWALARTIGPTPSSLAFDPKDKNVAYATYSTFGVPHVWKSTDGGVTFASIDGTGLTAIPDIPVNAIAVDPTNASRLYVGTDLGVFTSIDGGASWAVETTGFANVITSSLAIAGKQLFAFTYGRGAYRVSLTSQQGPRRRAARH